MPNKQLIIITYGLKSTATYPLWADERSYYFGTPSFRDCRYNRRLKTRSRAINIPGARVLLHSHLRVLHPPLSRRARLDDRTRALGDDVYVYAPPSGYYYLLRCNVRDADNVSGEAKVLVKNKFDNFRNYNHRKSGVCSPIKCFGL